MVYLKNGNISATSWKYGNTSTFTNYGYSYDALNRIVVANHIIPGQTVKSFYSTSYSYDRNGNITRLFRNAPTTEGTTGVMDRLDMAYDGNRLISAINSSNADDFMNCVRYEGENDMEYDENGCLTKDLDKNISSIQYNSLNLPTKINFSNDLYTTYMYDAKGQKVREAKHIPLMAFGAIQQLSDEIYRGEKALLQKRNVRQAPPLILSDIAYSIDYSGNLVFEDGKLKRILLDEGFIYFENNNTPTYHYYLKDHQGNNRAVVSAATKQKEESYDYYPFGKQFGDYHTGNIHPYRYNGKELDKINGLDWYYYGARMMEPAWGRFTTPDPLAEKYYNFSPYAYCANNPVNAVDPDGQAINGLVGGIIGAGVELTAQLIEKYDTDLSLMDNLSENVNWTNVTIAAGEGALTSGASAFKRLGAKVAVSAVTSATKEVSDQVKDGAKSYKDIDYQKVGINAIQGSAISFSSGKISQFSTEAKYHGVKASPTAKATMHKRAGQKRYSKSTLRNANKRLKKEKNWFSEKVTNVTDTFLNGVSSFIKRVSRNEEGQKQTR